MEAGLQRDKEKMLGVKKPKQPVWRREVSVNHCVDDLPIRSLGAEPHCPGRKVQGHLSSAEGLTFGSGVPDETPHHRCRDVPLTNRQRVSSNMGWHGKVGSTYSRLSRNTQLHGAGTTCSRSLKGWASRFGLLDGSFSSAGWIQRIRIPDGPLRSLL